MPTSQNIIVRPVTPSRWDDFARLFSGPGCPHYCWCTIYRFRNSRAISTTQRRAAMRRTIQSGTPVGVLAFEGDEPIGWCSVAPRGTYEKLERSRTMPRVDDQPTWTVLCFFVRRDHRRAGVMKTLLRAAIRYARANGAQAIEAYPYDTMGITSTHRGRSSAFRSAGFRQQGERWVLGRERS